MTVIVGVGIDLVEIARMEAGLRKEHGLKDQLFTEGEKAYCESMAMPAQHFAARFAAKEAFLKALGTGWRDGIGFREIEVTVDALGKPELQPTGTAKTKTEERSARAIHLSLSHDSAHAIAVVILEA